MTTLPGDRDVPASPGDAVRSYLAAFAGGDPDAIAAHVAEGFVNEHVSMLGEGSEGREEYRTRLPGFLAAMPGLRYDVERMVVDGGTVAVAYRLTATIDDRPVDVRGSMWFDVDSDGAIVRRVDYWDSAPFLNGARWPSARK